MTAESPTPLIFHLQTADGADDVSAFGASELRRGLRRAGARVVTRPRAGDRVVPLILTVDPACAEGDAWRVKASSMSVRLRGANGRSLLYAVYEFLKALGFVFDRPGVDCKPAEPLDRVPRLDMRGAARFPMRGVTPVPLGDFAAPLVDWMAKHGMNRAMFSPFHDADPEAALRDAVASGLVEDCCRRGIEITLAGHCFSHFLSRHLTKRHPEYLALKAGRRGRDSLGGHFCTTNRDAREAFIRNVLRFVSKHTWADRYAFWPNDGTGWCECEVCQAAGPPVERYLDLINEVAERVKRRFPDKKLDVLAYRDVLEPDRCAARRFPHVDAVMVCFMERDYSRRLDDPASPARICQRPDDLGGRNANRVYFGALRKWLRAFPGKVTVFEYYAKDMWVSLPNLLTGLIHDELALFESLGVQGVGIHYVQRENWSAYRLNYLAAADCMWRDPPPAADIVERFCRRAYGPAWREMTRFHALVGREFFNHMKWYWRFDFESVRVPDGADALLRAALRRTREVAHRREVKKWIVSMEYVRRVAEAREWLGRGAVAAHVCNSRFWISQNRPREAAARLRDVLDYATRNASDMINAASPRLRDHLPELARELEALADRNVRLYEEGRRRDPGVD